MLLVFNLGTLHRMFCFIMMVPPFAVAFDFSVLDGLRMPSTEIVVLKRVAQSQLLRLFDDDSDNTALLL